MAQSNPITALTDSLFNALCENQKNNPKLRRYRDNFARKLRTHNYVRTNQFEVYEKLDGLQEKFTVLDNDELADGLHTRLIELRGRKYKFAPDVLDLLLRLSNDPLGSGRLEDLNKLVAPEPIPTLTWADIEKTDPIDRKDKIWRTIQFTDYSSDEDEILTSSSPSTPPPEKTEEKTAGSELTLPFRPVEVDEKLEDSLHKAQFWLQENDDRVIISELQVLREAIFMLHGLPTAIFWRVGDMIETDKRYSISTLEYSTFREILASFASIGMQVHQVRSSIHDLRGDLPLQTFQQAVESTLDEFDSFLSNLEAQYLKNTAYATTTLIALLEEVRCHLEPLVAIGNILATMRKAGRSDAVSCMETVFDAISLLEVTGPVVASNELEKIFLKTFATYIRPIWKWMKTGNLSTVNSFFVNRTESLDKTRLWSDWFTTEGKQSQHRVPNFMESHAHLILVTGKSSALAQLLNCLPPDDSTLDLSSLISSPQNSTSTQVAFENRFEDLMDGFIRPLFSSATTSLHEFLDQRCGLRKTISALRMVYFGHIGYSADILAKKIFDRIDKCQNDWNDQYVLGQLLKASLADAKAVDTQMIKAQSIPGFSRDLIRRRRSVNILKGLVINYNIPWSLANIISKPSLVGYQRVSTLLLQIRRAVHAIERRSLQQLPLMDKRIYRKVYAVRQQLLNFTKSLFDHLTGFVIETAWVRLSEAFDQAGDLDSMIKAHNDFVMGLQHHCFLTKALKPLREAILAVLDLCIQFADVTSGSSSLDKDSNADAASFVTTKSRARNRNLVAVESSDEDESDEEGYSIFEVDDDRPYTDKLTNLESQLKKQLVFIVAGLRGLARADGNPISWEILAERLGLGNHD